MTRIKLTYMQTRAAFAGLALAMTLAVLASCGTLGVRNPVATAQTPEQKAYALVELYRVAVEEAADIAEAPTTPRSVISVLQQAEKIATPLALELKAAAQAYGNAEEALKLLPKDAGLIDKAAIALKGLNDAWREGAAPMQALIAAVKQWKEG